MLDDGCSLLVELHLVLWWGGLKGGICVVLTGGWQTPLPGW